MSEIGVVLVGLGSMVGLAIIVIASIIHAQNKEWKAEEQMANLDDKVKQRIYIEEARQRLRLARPKPLVEVANKTVDRSGH